MNKRNALAFFVVMSFMAGMVLAVNLVPATPVSVTWDEYATHESSSVPHAYIEYRLVQSPPGSTVVVCAEQEVDTGLDGFDAPGNGNIPVPAPEAWDLDVIGCYGLLEEQTRLVWRIEGEPPIYGIPLPEQVDRGDGWILQQLIDGPDEPLAGLTASNDSPTVLGSPTTLAATVSAGSRVSYTWALGDGQSASAQVVTHTYPSNGVYTALVTAANSVSLLTGTTSVTILHEPEPATFWGTASVGGSPAPDGTIVSAWISGTQYAYAPTALVAGQSVYTLDVPGDDFDTPYLVEGGVAGDTVSFKIDSFEAGQTGTWHEGTSTNLDLNPLPTDVSLASFTAQADAQGAVTLRWETVSEIDVLGFNLYRDTQGHRERLNGALILAQGPGSPVGAAYEYVDGPLPPSTYDYWLEVVDHAGQGSLHGPAQATVIADEPLAALTVSNDGPTALGSATTLTATISAGSGVAYTWVLGDGRFASGPVILHTYPSTGVYTALVTATNAVSLLTATTSVNVVSSISHVYLPVFLREVP